MTENKLYAQCREEARKQFEQRYKDAQTITGKGGFLEIDEEVSQLTAEIYGMKLLDMIQPNDTNDTWYMRTSNDNWTNSETYDDIGTTKQLHDHFVREFNVSLIDKVNNGKQ